MKLTFHGAAQTVTGSKHLITLNSGTQILLDCGMFQGLGAEADTLNRHWGFLPSKVDYLILSHAHIDHSGLIPKLVKDGFRGKIICTPATFDLCKIMLMDSAHIQEADVRYINRKKEKSKSSLIRPLYEKDDVPFALERFYTLDYKKKYKIEKGIELHFTDAGHILGSAAVHLDIQERNETIRLTYTGDIGRKAHRILRKPQKFRQADILIMESTYGSNLHKTGHYPERKLLEIVKHTCLHKKGKLIIPAFSVGRTQEIVNILNNLEFENKLPPLKVFVDSPLAVNATEIYRKYKKDFNKEMQSYMDLDKTPFGFKNLTYIQDVQESKMLNFLEEPAIIISASGMADAGRIKHHIANHIEDAKTTILIAGWCAPNTLGRKLLRGDKEVRIFGQNYPVRAEVMLMNEFSAHADYNEMLQYLKCQEAKSIQKIFLVHGDEDVLPQWKNKLLEHGFQNISTPELHQEFEI